VGARPRAAVPPRHRRHLLAAGAAHGVPHPALHGLPAADPARGTTDAGTGRSAAAARGGHARHLRGPRPAAVLRVLRGRPRADVVRHRPVGRRQDPGRPAARGQYVHPLHRAGQRSHAARHPARRPHRRHLRHRRADQPGRRRPEPPHPGARLPRPRARACSQGTDVALALVAARRAHRGSDRRLGPARRRTAEDGHLRPDPHRGADRAGGRRGAGAVPRRASRRRHPLRLAGLPGPDRPQAADRVLQRRAHGLRSAWHLDAHRHRHQRRPLRQRRARPDHRPAVLPGRCHQGPPPHGRPRPARWRPLRADAAPRRPARLRGRRQPRAARAGRVLGRDARAARCLRPRTRPVAAVLPRADGPGRGRRGAHHDVLRHGRAPGGAGQLVPGLEGRGAAARRHHLVVWSPVVLLVVAFGLWPGWLLEATDPVVRRLLGSS
jgi:hypothetical protein